MSKTTGFVGTNGSEQNGLVHTFTLAPARLAAAALMCPKKDIRPYLFGVLVEVDATGARLVGTDGKMLLAVFDAQGGCPTAPPEGLRLWVSETHVKQLCAAKPRDAERVEVRVDLEAGAVLMSRDNVLLDSQESLENGRIYPDWRNIVPQQVSRKSALFDAGLLGQFDKVPPALGLKNSDSAPRLHMNGKDPAVVLFGEDFVLGIVAPRREDHPQDAYAVPAWARKPEVAQAQSVAAVQTSPASDTSHPVSAPRRRGRPPKHRVVEPAQVSAASATSLSQQGPAAEPAAVIPKRRGRPPKNRDTPSSEAPPVGATPSASAVATAPKRRGRPPKNRPPATAQESPFATPVSAGAASAPKRRGRPPKNRGVNNESLGAANPAGVPAQVAAPSPKRRGRPPKPRDEQGRIIERPVLASTLHLAHRSFDGLAPAH